MTESEPEIHDAEVVPYEQPAQQVSLFGTDDPLEIVAQATLVADALKNVLDTKGLTSNIKGKQHVRVEGWQLLGSMLGITAVCVNTEKIDGGWKATVEARRASDSGVIGRADAICTKFEKSGPWKSADDYALLAMAQTRAVSRALRGPLGFVVSLAGYSPTAAEEIPEDGPAFVDHSAVPQEAVLQPIDFGDDEILAENLKGVFRDLKYKRGKVRVLMSECESHEDRLALLHDLTELLPKDAA